jgi:hypothetical protein
LEAKFGANRYMIQDIDTVIEIQGITIKNSDLKLIVDSILNSYDFQFTWNKMSGLDQCLEMLYDLNITSYSNEQVHYILNKALFLAQAQWNIHSKIQK